ncbi:MAG: signal peptide peptidase SppA [Planctomycetota bacterium]
MKLSRPMISIHQPTVVWLGLLLIPLSGCGPTSFLITPVPADQRLQENVLQRESVWATQKIALIDISGILRNNRDQSLTGVSGENPVALFKEKLDRAARDKRVRAIVLRINSPGGGVTASDLMYTELRKFRQRTGKPVIACFLDVAASGGYYLACAADRIFAHPTTVTGSIGVIMLAPEFSDTMQKIGVRMNVIKSGALKDAGSFFRTMNVEDRAVFETMIEQMYQRFLEVVRSGRPDIPANQLLALADGRVFLAPDALKYKLVDEIGTLEDALLAAKTAAGLDAENILVVGYSRPLAHRPNIYARGDTPPAQVNMLNIQLPDWLSNPSPQFMYLWAPTW